MCIRDRPGPERAGGAGRYRAQAGAKAKGNQVRRMRQHEPGAGPHGAECHRVGWQRIFERKLVLGHGAIIGAGDAFIAAAFAVLQNQLELNGW